MSIPSHNSPPLPPLPPTPLLGPKMFMGDQIPVFIFQIIFKSYQPREQASNVDSPRVVPPLPTLGLMTSEQKYNSDMNDKLFLVVFISAQTVLS